MTNALRASSRMSNRRKPPARSRRADVGVGNLLSAERTCSRVDTRSAARTSSTARSLASSLLALGAPPSLSGIARAHTACCCSHSIWATGRLRCRVLRFPPFFDEGLLCAAGSGYRYTGARCRTARITRSTSLRRRRLSPRGSKRVGSAGRRLGARGRSVRCRYT